MHIAVIAGVRTSPSAHKRPHRSSLQRVSLSHLTCSPAPSSLAVSIARPRYFTGHPRVRRIFPHVVEIGLALLCARVVGCTLGRVGWHAPALWSHSGAITDNGLGSSSARRGSVGKGCCLTLRLADSLISRMAADRSLCGTPVVALLADILAAILAHWTVTQTFVWR